METKHFGVFSLKADGKAGQITGYCAAWGDASHPDLDGDVLVKGAFTKTLRSGRVIPILWQHQQDKPIGKALELREDSRGLFTTGQISKGTQLGDNALALADMGVLSLSMGYVVPEGGSERKGGIRYLKEVDLREFSVVTFPANPDAVITGVKAIRSDLDANALRSAATATLLAQQGSQDSDRAIDEIAKLIDITKYGNQIQTLRDAHQSTATALQMLSSVLRPILYRQDINFPTPMGRGADGVDGLANPGGKSALHDIQTLASRLRDELNELNVESQRYFF